MKLWRWLRKFFCRSRQGCILVGVATCLWVVTTFNINSTAVVNRGSEQINPGVYKLSKLYNRSLARDNESVGNGSYADLKKMVPVLLENILERLNKVEHRLNTYANVSSIRAKPGTPREQHSILAHDLIEREQPEQCRLTDKEKQQYPKCQGKIEWMEKMWKKDLCYASYGVDGSVCSFIMYLSEIEDWCPRSAWNGSNFVPTQDIFWMQSANITKTLDGLMKLLQDPNARHAYAWIRMRIGRIWPRWEEAITIFTQKQDSSKRRPKQASHGKDAADGVGASIKRAADNQVIVKKNDITNAKDFVDLLTSADTNIKLFPVSEEAIMEMEAKISSNIQAIPNTMKLHQLVLKTPGTIAHRFVSCFCGLPGKLLCECFTPETIHFDQPSNVEKDKTVPSGLDQDESSLREISISKKKSLQPVDSVEDDLVGKYIVVIYDGIPFPVIVLDVDEEEVEVKILVHMGLLSKQSGFGFAETQSKGGPLGELVQWLDLIAALYVLGHQLTITSEADQLSSIVSKLIATNSHCQSGRRLSVDLIYIDIVGLKQFKTYVGKRYSSFSCLLRILDSFGTEPAFNLLSFARQREKLTYWGGQDLMPQQIFNMFPHTPDNSFMGFVVERHSNVKDTEKSNIAVVYGKNDYMWKDKADYLNIVNKSGMVIHGTVYKKVKLVHIPSYVINHGVLNGEDLHALLRKSKIFLGLGFPYEGPAPLEAIANGAVFINPKFAKPHNRNNTAFFKGKPTEREVTSQHPYAEQFIGEPYVYTIDINDLDEVRTTIQKIIEADHFKGLIPYEYTEEGFIQRMNAYIEHQNFCHLPKQLTKWPPESAVQILFGEVGKSCKDVCWEKNLICEPSHFLETNAHNALLSHGASCAGNKTFTDIFYPALDTETNDCILQQEELLFSCVGKQENLRRLCPCRNYIKGQMALCLGCET